MKIIALPCGDNVDYRDMVKYSARIVDDSKVYFNYLCGCGQDYSIPVKDTIILTEEDLTNRIVNEKD